MNNRRLFAIFLVVFIDLLGFGLILPLLPFYAEVYDATPTVVGFLTASYAAAQLVGAPLLGRLSDRYGRRPILLISIFGTACGFLLLGAADPLGRWASSLFLPTASLSTTNVIILTLLFASRILDGLTGGNISVAQAYITDVTDEEGRAKGLGLVGAAFGLGFILGPAMGGLLSNWGYATPAYVAAVLAFLNWLAVARYLPESLSASERERLARNPKRKFSFTAFKAAFQRPKVGPLLQVRFFYGLAFAIFQTIFALFAQYKLGLDAQQTGFILTYVGLLVALVQGVGIGFLTSRFSENDLIAVSVVAMAISLLAWAFTPNVPLLLIILMPLALAGGVLNTILNSSLTKAVKSEEVGGILGISASLESATRTIAPSLGGVLLGRLGTWAPGVFASMIMLWVIVYTYRRLLPDMKIQFAAPSSSD